MNHQDTKTPRGDSVTQEDFREDNLARQVIDAAFAVHSALGPGLLESVYEACLAKELTDRKIAFKKQMEVPVVYKGLVIEAGFRLDFLVDDKIVVELKAVESVLPIHKAQILTYMKLQKKRLGLLINFNVPLLKEGVSRLTLR